MSNYLELMIVEAGHLADEHDRFYGDAIEARDKAQGGGKDFWNEQASFHSHASAFLREARGYFINALYHGE